MAEVPRIRFRLTLTGAAVIFIPPLVLLQDMIRGEPPALIIGVGLPALAGLSLLFILAAAPFVVRGARRIKDAAAPLPETWVVDKPLCVETDPKRVVFLPGVRLFMVWTLRFGPLRKEIFAPLPPRGTGRSELCFRRRGEWSIRPFLRAGDPFGFFCLEVRCNGQGMLALPPRRRELGFGDLPGQLVAERATASRLKEDAQEKLDRRTYIPGDDPRRLDWKHYARTGDFLVRVGDEGVPFRGRIWILVLGSPISRRPRLSLRRLDAGLEAADALIRRLSDEGQDIQVLLPGEEVWKPVSRDWDKRLAGSQPTDSSPRLWPGSGERLWIVAHPGEPQALELAQEARDRALQVSLGYSHGPVDGKEFSADKILRHSTTVFRGGRLSAFLNNRLLHFAEDRAGKIGIHARRL